MSERSFGRDSDPTEQSFRRSRPHVTRPWEYESPAKYLPVRWHVPDFHYCDDPDDLDLDRIIWARSVTLAPAEGDVSLALIEYAMERVSDESRKFARTWVQRMSR